MASSSFVVNVANRLFQANGFAPIQFAHHVSFPTISDLIARMLPLKSKAVLMHNGFLYCAFFKGPPVDTNKISLYIYGDAKNARTRK